MASKGSKGNHGRQPEGSMSYWGSGVWGEEEGVEMDPDELESMKEDL